MQPLDHTYRPNWSDPRVKKRVETVLDWCEVHLRDSLDRFSSAHELNKLFGPKGNKLGDYLRARLLIRSGRYEVGSTPFKYRLVKDAIEKVQAELTSISSSNDDTSFARVSRYHRRYQDELETLEFKMNLKSNRYWHGALNIPRDIKPAFWAPYLPYNYDIQACAPTLLLQVAEKANLTSELAGPINEYLSNRDAYRKRIADLSGLSYDQSKRLLNSLFNGARLAKSGYCSAYRVLLDTHPPGQATSHMGKLQEDEVLSRLRASIKSLWKKIELHLSMPVSTSRDKWNLYFYLEKSVLDAMTEELTQQGLKYFTEHDGFRTNRPADIQQVISAVKRQTGFYIELATTNSSNDDTSTS